MECYEYVMAIFTRYEKFCTAIPLWITTVAHTFNFATVEEHIKCISVLIFFSLINRETEYKSFRLQF